ncbi:hypothetical protein, partial [Victivallis vadensis]
MMIILSNSDSAFDFADLNAGQALAVAVGAAIALAALHLESDDLLAAELILDFGFDGRARQNRGAVVQLAAFFTDRETSSKVTLPPTSYRA